MAAGKIKSLAAASSKKIAGLASGNFSSHLSVVVSLNAKGQQIHRALKLILLEDVSDTDLVLALAGRCVHRSAGS